MVTTDQARKAQAEQKEREAQAKQSQDTGIANDGRSSEANTTAASENAKRDVTPKEPLNAERRDAPSHTAAGDTPSTQAARDAVASSAGRKPGTTPEQGGASHDLSDDAANAREQENGDPDDTRTARNRRGSKKSGLADLTDQDLNDPVDGHAMPLSAQTENLQATVVNYNGRALLKIAVRGYIGEEPVTILAENAGEFQELIGELEKGASEQKKVLDKRRKDNN